MKTLTVLGSTGSIGKSTLDVVATHPDRFRIKALAARNSIGLLEEQIKRFAPDVVAVLEQEAAETLRKRSLPVEVLEGEQGMIAAATLEETDTVVSAIVGSPGLLPTLEAIRAGKDIALATKEALVMAGDIVMAEASKRGVSIIPVDSEHSAVFQCLDGRSMDEVEQIVLTASGGPFLTKSIASLKDVTPAEALKHPNWDMGKKITIDSATLMNKGLEVIEARWLFNVPIEKIGVILHPQSIIHSMVKFIDGSVIAQMSVPDMKGPISYALSYPERYDNILPSLDLAGVGELTFQDPDNERYPSLSLTFRALEQGGTMPCVLNTANEIAVEAFLNEEIPFTGIVDVVEKTMRSHTVSSGSSLEEIVHASTWARQKASEIVTTGNESLDRR